LAAAVAPFGVKLLNPLLDVWCGDLSEVMRLRKNGSDQFFSVYQMTIGF